MTLPNEVEILHQRLAELESENQRLSKDLQQSKELSRKIFHASSNMMAIHTLKDGRYIDVNEAAASLGGYTREELIGKPVKDGIHIESLGVKDLVEQKLREKGRAHGLEMKVCTKSGELRTVLFSVDPITVGDEPCVLAVSVDITEREKRADALRRSEEKYRMLVENSLQAVAIVQDARFVFFNSRFPAILGYTPEELYSVSLHDMVELTYPEQREFLLSRYREVLSESTPAAHFECQGKRKDGTPVWLEVYASKIDYNENPAFQAVCMDITERKKTESALRESEEMLRGIAETIDEIFWVFDMEKNATTYLSPAFERIWGYPRECVMGRSKPFDDPILPEYRPYMEAGVDQMRQGLPLDFEYCLVRPDGSIRNIRHRGYPIRGKDGRVLRYIGVGQDVTEWRRAEKALTDSKDYLNQIINCIGDPIFVKDRQHRFVLVNDAMCAYIEKPREQLLGKAADTSVLAVPFIQAEEEVFRTGKETTSEDTFPSQEGPRTFMTKKSLLTDKGGNQQVVGVLREVTEYKRLEAQFLQAQKMEAIGVLAGGVAHDFNNLLNVINGYAELVLDELGSDSELRDDVEQIRSAGTRAAMLTSQLLAFGRKQIMQMEIIDLNQVITDMSSMLRRMIGEDLKMLVNVHAQPLLINADIGKIQQVVMNLVINARDAMPNGGSLLIETSEVDFNPSFIKDPLASKPGPYAMLSITDNGTGMDDATQAHIFEPFFTTKGKEKGTGLGLSTVYGIVQQSNGSIQVSSESGKGTTIRVYLPRETQHEISYSYEDKADSGTRGAETILLAEDEEAVRSLTSRVLRDRGYTVIEAADGLDALRIARESRLKIDMVLTDVVMPGMGGKLLVSNLEMELPGIRSLYISGYTDDAIVHHGILDSNVNFLQKPFSIEALLHKVREVLSA